MAEAATLFPDFFADSTGLAGPSSVAESSPSVSIDQASAIGDVGEGATERLAAGVVGLSMNGPSEAEGSGSGSKQTDEEIVDYE
jgi:hypothetical protein